MFSQLNLINSCGGNSSQALTLSASAWKGLSIRVAQKAQIPPTAEMQAMEKGSKEGLLPLIEITHLNHRSCSSKNMRRANIGGVQLPKAVNSQMPGDLF